ncbi:flavodoxin family protein [Natronincola ferrireducens]|uniref:NADPH-dependent FMN reductase n=1 Tax=Natronincola ferrireducens TaxID=393762 RepID=A0A1G9ELV9_9FIRM|nr:NAD(P)H-dependent oxidoreductase [Natronincola ferrireducens]SDK77078.1 NADPH-dependent FMN reductase [Natronincola ferrireducens]
MIHLIMCGEPSLQLSNMVAAATQGYEVTVIKTPDNIPNMQNKKILFAIEVDPVGFNMPLFKILSSLTKRGNGALNGSTGGLLIHSPSNLYTKTLAKSVVFAANQLGCSFIGHSLVEATKNLSNFLTWQKKFDMSLEEISYELSFRLGKRLVEDRPPVLDKSKIVVLHSSSKQTSNTLMLWHMIKYNLINCEIDELHVENGTVLDCIGCPYQTCKHLGMQNSCYYGGMMVKEILPAIERADALIWICPNYNDSISANLMAVINRLTALYRKMKFYDKAVFAVIISANSGSDAVAGQLIDALNINKGFRLPPYFSIMEIANDPGTIVEVDGIEDKAKTFAINMMSHIHR